MMRRERLSFHCLEFHGLCKFVFLIPCTLQLIGRQLGANFFVFLRKRGELAFLLVHLKIDGALFNTQARDPICVS